MRVPQNEISDAFWPSDSLVLPLSNLFPRTVQMSAESLRSSLARAEIFGIAELTKGRAAESIELEISNLKTSRLFGVRAPGETAPVPIIFAGFFSRFRACNRSEKWPHLVREIDLF
jgi:hypothetical protein